MKNVWLYSTLYLAGGIATALWVASRGSKDLPHFAGNTAVGGLAFTVAAWPYVAIKNATAK